MTQAQQDAPHREWGPTRSSSKTVTRFFGPGSPYLGHPLLTEERTAAEVDRILSWCESAPTNVLDMGCGFGRHSIEFAQRGHGVVGVDPSQTMLDEATRRATSVDVNAEFVLASGSEFVRDASFDLAVSLFTTLGQIDSPEGDPQVEATLANLSRSLRPGGTLVIEVPEKERAIDGLVSTEQLGPTAVTRSFEPATSVLTERFVTPADTFELAYVLFSKAELVAALERAGFEISATYDEAVQAPPNTFVTLVARNNGPGQEVG